MQQMSPATILLSSLSVSCQEAQGIGGFMLCFPSQPDFAPVSPYLHLHFPGFGEQCKHNQPSAGTRDVTISLVLINKHASLSLPHSCSLTPQLAAKGVPAHFLNTLSPKWVLLFLLPLQDKLG